MTGYAVPVAPASLGQSEGVHEVTQAIGQIVDTLTSAVNALSAELVFAREGRTGEIPYISHLTRGEILNEIARAADGIAAIADAVSTGTLSGYADPFQEALASTSYRANGVAQAARAEGASELLAGNESAAEDHLLEHTADPRDLRASAERLVVELENGDVPVIEPGEREIAMAEGVLAGIGAIAVGALLIYVVVS